MLDSEKKLNSRSLWNVDGHSPDAYVNILKQRDIKLLGRSIDINKILGQMVDHYLRTSVDVAISRFESSELTSILVVKIN